MKIIYMGTPEFAVPTLEKLYQDGHEIIYVITQPDAIRDRGKKIKFTPVKEKAVQLELDVLQPQRIKLDEETIAKMQEAKPEVIVVAAYGQILSKEILDIPSKGCINVHASILPKYRGAAPIQRAIMDGEEETGISIMYMAEGLDTGDVLATQKTKIGNKTAGELQVELSNIGADLLARTITNLDDIDPVEQNDEEAIYASMLSKKEGHIDFEKSPEENERKIRAFDPWPGTFAYEGENLIKFWSAEIPGISSNEANGTVVNLSELGMDIVSGGEVIRMTQIQLPGKKRVEVKEYLRGNPIEINTILG